MTACSADRNHALRDFASVNGGNEGTSMILYKYLSKERIEVLRDCRIRYSQPGALNDPFEVKFSFDKLAKDSESIKFFREQMPKSLKEEYAKTPAVLQELIPFDTFLSLALQNLPEAAFIKIMDEFTPKARQMITDGFDKNIGIFSLTENPNNQLMWSHYADSHQGFVLGFNADHKYFHQQRSEVDEFGYLRKVEYRENRPSCPMIELTGTDVFLVKSLQWKYEEEWRVIRPLRDADEMIMKEPYPIFLFSFPPEVIREVILGHKMPAEKKTEITSFVRSNFDSVKLFQVEIDSQSFGLKLQLL